MFCSFSLSVEARGPPALHADCSIVHRHSGIALPLHDIHGCLHLSKVSTNNWPLDSRAEVRVKGRVRVNMQIGFEPTTSVFYCRVWIEKRMRVNMQSNKIYLGRPSYDRCETDTVAVHRNLAISMICLQLCYFIGITRDENEVNTLLRIWIIMGELLHHQLSFQNR